MFIANNQHYSVIADQIKKSQIIWFAMAYVSDAGVKRFEKDIKGKNIKLICNIDLGSTTLLAIKRLLKHKAQIKIYTPKSGIFHPKLWLFGNADAPTQFIIGSANLTYGGLSKNIEASALITEPDIVKGAYNFFQGLWGNHFAEKIKPDTLDSLINLAKKREKQQRAAHKIVPKAGTKKIEELLEFTNQWVEFPFDKQFNETRIWRGWYIVPDHGYINDELINQLRVYLPDIKGSIDISKKSTDPNWINILKNYHTTLANRSKTKMSERDLFVRAHKNYLLKFGWAEHPQGDNGTLNKGKIRLTPIGAKVRDAKTLEEVRAIYTEYFMDFEFFSFKILPFLTRIIYQVEHVSFEEMSYFVKHARADDDIDLIVRIIKIYRSLNSAEKEKFHDKFKAHFDKYKEPTGTNVYSNYTKSVKHTISAIAWCNFFRSHDESLRLEQ